jgi:hypothetical protein
MKKTIISLIATGFIVFGITTGAAAEEVKTIDSGLVTTQSIQDPGNGGGGGN